jgi:hypothetical protein
MGPGATVGAWTSTFPPALLGSVTVPAGETFTLSVPLEQPFFLAGIAPGEWQITLPEMIATGGSVELPPYGLGTPIARIGSMFGMILNSYAPDYMPILGVLGITVTTVATCSSPVGATISISGVDPDAGRYGVLYTGADGLPSSATAITGTQSPSAYAYNLPVNVDLSVVVTHPTCKQGPPLGTSGLTLTGKVRVVPSSTNAGAASVTVATLE